MVTPPPSFVPALRLRRRAIVTSVAVGGGLLAIKFLAAALTGSAAILSDALESIINLVAKFYLPQQGVIRIDARDLRTIASDSLQPQALSGFFSLMSQRAGRHL